MNKLDKSKTLSIKLGGDLLKTIRKHADSTGFEVSYYIRLTLARHFNVPIYNKSVKRAV